MPAARLWHFPRPVAGRTAPGRTLLDRIVDRSYQPVERAYMVLLGFVMRHRYIVVVGCVLALGSLVPLGKTVKRGFLPDSDEAHFEVNVRAPEGTTLEQTALVGERIARATRDLPEVESTLVSIGDNAQRAPNLANIYVKLSNPDQRKATQEQIMEHVRREILAKQDPALRTDASLVPMFSGGMSQAIITYDLSGPDLATLQRYSGEAVQRMKKIPGAVDVGTSLVSGKPELGAFIDRDKASAPANFLRVILPPGYSSS